MSAPDDERTVDLTDDGPEVLADSDDEAEDTARYLEDRPPHWG